MKNIKALHDFYMQALYGLIKWSTCSEWGVATLVENKEIEDDDIILLASSESEGEIKELTENILQRCIPGKGRNNEYWAGKYIVELHKKYCINKIDIHDLEYIINKLYNNLGYPNWLVMLARNCEFATDVQAFEVPFKEEFNYINELWESCESIDDFNKIYSREISNTHDFKSC